LLVAAARESGCQLITADRTLLAYGAEVMAFTNL
jgi:predicted nucleic acid-binding protein